MLLIGSCFYTEPSEQKNMISEIPYRERSSTVIKTNLSFARPTFKGAIFECNPYLFLRLNDFRSYSHLSGPEYVFTIFVIHKLFPLKNYSTFLCAQLYSPEKRKEKKILVFSLLLRSFRNVKNEMLCYPVGGTSRR